MTKAGAELPLRAVWLPERAAVTVRCKDGSPSPPTVFHLPDPEGVRGLMGCGSDATGAPLLLDTVVRSGAPRGIVEWWAKYAGGVFYFSPDNARSLVMRSWRDKTPFPLGHMGLVWALLRPASAARYVAAWQKLQELRTETVRNVMELRQEALAQADRMALARYDTWAESAAAKAQVDNYRVVVIHELGKYVGCFTAHVNAEQLAVLAALFTRQQMESIEAENTALLASHPLLYLVFPRNDGHLGVAETTMGRPWLMG